MDVVVADRGGRLDCFKKVELNECTSCQNQSLSFFLSRAELRMDFFGFSGMERLNTNHTKPNPIKT